MPIHGLVLTAAGASVRLGRGVSKVLLPLRGVPMLARAARAFREALGPMAVVVTARPQDRDAVEALVAAEPALAGAVVVAGGATRQASVTAGVAALPAQVEVILVHDAARPLVRPDLVRAVARAAARDGASAPATPLADSVHREDGSGRLVATLPRGDLRAVQTPQAARAPLLRRALAEAAARGREGTDEVGLLIEAGIPVTAVPGDPENLKVTTAADLDRAERLLAEREGQA